MNFNKTMYIMRGVPGSGKSTLAHNIAPKECIFSTDDFWGPLYEFDITRLGEAHRWNEQRVKDAALANLTPIVVDNTNILKRAVDVYVEIAKENGYTVVIAESFDPLWSEFKGLARRYNDPTIHGLTLDEMARINARREYIIDVFAKRNIHNVPKITIENMLDRYEAIEFTDIVRPYSDTAFEFRDFLKAYNNTLLSNAFDFLFSLKFSFPKHDAYIVGGCVRDILLGLPIKDVDICTNIPVQDLVHKFHCHDIGKSKDFGIVTVTWKPGVTFEVSHFREEFGTSNNRHPDNVHLIESFKGDTTRRDFTINSMGINVYGVLVDFNNGLTNLNNHILRCVGNPVDRFTEDALRILRCIRFAAVYNLNIDPKTCEGIWQTKHLLRNISQERITDELFKVAESGPALATFITQLDVFGILDILFPEVANFKGYMHNGIHHPEGGQTLYGAFSVMGHVIEVLKASKTNNPLYNVAALFHDIGKPSAYRLKDGKHTYYGHETRGEQMFAEIGTRLKLANTQINLIQFCCGKHMLVHNLDTLSLKTLIPLIQSEFWPALKEVSYMDEASRGSTHFDINEFNKRISDAEEKVRFASAGQDFNKTLREYVTGERVLQVVPEISITKKYIGLVLQKVKDVIISKIEKKEEITKEFVDEQIKIAYTSICNEQ